MTKKRNVKANADEETDRSCRESSSDGSVLENPINNGTKNSRSRKCKAQVLNNTANILKIKRTPKSKRLSESSCDSVAKEVSECNLAKQDGEMAPNDENSTLPQQSVVPIGNNSEEPMIFAAMTKKKNVKANIDEETDRSFRESSSDGSVLENPINSGTKNRRSRMCKTQVSNKIANNLKIETTPKSKGLSESCDSAAKEESNLAIENGKMVPNDESKTMTQESVDPIGNNSQEPIPDDKQDPSKINSGKYSELLSILSGKEGDIDNFIKQFTIWKQSQSDTGKQLKNKKNSPKSQTLQKPMKSKVTKTTPLVRLTKKASSKKLNKVSKNKSPLRNKNDLKEPDSPISEKKKNNTDSSSSLGPESTNTEIKNGDSDEGIALLSDSKTEDDHSKETAEDIADCSKDIHTDIKSGTVHSRGKSKSPWGNSSGIKRGKKKHEELPKTEIPECPSPIDTHVEAGDADFKENTKNPINTKSENSSSKEIKVSDKEDPHTAPEITNKIVNKVEKSVSEGEGNLKNEEINNVNVDWRKKDLVQEDEDKTSKICENDNLSDFPDSVDLLLGTIQENNDKNNSSSSDSSDGTNENVEVNDSNKSNHLNIKDSFSEIAVNDVSDNRKTNQSVTDKSLDSTVNGTLPYLKSKSLSCSSLSNIENNRFDECKHSDNENKEKAEDKCDTSAVLNVNNSPLIERDSETDTVWKRKRKMSDENSECSKRTKRATRLSEVKFDETQHDITSSEPPCNKWNTEESISFLEELIYSDEDKINNFPDIDISYNVFKSADEATKRKENSIHKIKNITSKFDLDKKMIEKSNTVKNNRSHKDEIFDDSREHFKGSSNTENTNIRCRKDHKEQNDKRSTNARVSDSSRSTKEQKEKKSTNARFSGSSRSTKHHAKEKDKITKISSKSKKQMKSKERPKSKKSSSNHRDDIEDLQIKREFDNSYESMLKKVKKQLKNGHRSILETDLPVVEVSYKGESLHGILGSVHGVDFLTRYKLNKEKHSNENILSSSYAQDLLIQSLRPLCSEMLRESCCKDAQNCRKEHVVPNDFFSIMDKHDAWLIVAFILRISNCLPENLLTAILEFLSKYKAKRKILLVSRHIFQSQQNNLPVVKSCWEDILTALECCGLQRWEGIRSVIQFIIDTYSSPKVEVFHQLLKIWNVHGSSFSNTWQIVEPLVTGKIIVLQPLILSKLMGEIIAAEPKDKVDIYRLLVHQLTSLTKDNFTQISYHLLNDFLRKVSQEGLHSEEKVLREIMNTSYYSPFLPQQSPDHSNSSSLRRCRSMIDLTSVSSDNKFHVSTTVHEEEKMEAAMQRALQCSNYDSVIKVIIASYKKVFINKVLLAVFKYVMDKNSLIILKNIFVKIKTSFAQYVEEIKDLIGNIVVTVMLDYVKQYNWKEANNYFTLLEENHVNKYKLKSLTDVNLRPVRLAVVYSEIHYYNGRYKESIGIFINTRIIDPDSEQWVVPGGTEEDFRIIGVMIVFLLNELINKKIVNIATMLFKAVFEAQSSLTEPIDIGHFFEVLLYKLFELTEEYPETAVKLYMRVIAKDSSVTLYGLTYRALIILAYRTHKRAIIKDIFYKAINEYVYPIIEENENVITLLRSHTEEEIIVYILEWVARFKEKQSDSCDHQIQIKFKDAVLEDYLDNKVLGIPAVLKEVDQTLPGAFMRLTSVLKRLHIKFKQIKKDTFSIDPSSFQNFLNKIKVY